MENGGFAVVKVTFFGVRGSIATPLRPDQIQSKISAVVSQITEKDVQSEDAKQRFIANLTPDLFGTVGGNSACVRVVLDSGDKIILDAGTGIRGCGKEYQGTSNNVFNLLITHFHWDHLQGLPFFDAAFNPTNTINIYSTSENAKELLSAQMSQPYFPVPMEAFTKNIFYHCIEELEQFIIGDAKIMCKKMFHPGFSYAYKIQENGKTFIHATDVELQQIDFQRSIEADNFFGNADVLVLDSQYTVDDALQKENWGHSAFCYAIDFAHLFNIRELYLFHHEPTYDDKKLYSILKSAQWYSDNVCYGEVHVHLAIEGQDIIL